MDINLLLLDVGHARVKLGVVEAGELVTSQRVALDQPENLAGAIEELWRRLDGKGAEVAGAASNKPAGESVAAIVQKATGQRPQWVGADLDVPIQVATREPGRTGVDRVLNVAAAYEQLKKACVVIDAGSAVTVDFCDDSGKFLGGCIAPGAAAQSAALNTIAPHLPLIKVTATDAAYGDGTESAINCGIVNGLRGLVRHAVEQHAMTLDTWPEVIATGGDAAELFGGWELVHAVSPDLTLYGIGHAYASHHVKHGT